ncbi:helix-turn-helix transcriptional regulator [Oxalobacteraceae bacterium A2-2]
MNYPIQTVQQLRPLLVGFRKRLGLSQAAVAELLGVTQQSYAKIEANPATTSVERLFTILRLLGVEIGVSQVVASGEEVASGTVVSASSDSVRRKARVAAPARIQPPSKTVEDW